MTSRHQKYFIEGVEKIFFFLSARRYTVWAGILGNRFSAPNSGGNMKDMEFNAGIRMVVVSLAGKFCGGRYRQVCVEWFVSVEGGIGR